MSSPAASGVAILFPDQDDETARMLARAFQDDLLFRAMINLPEPEFATRLQRLFRVILQSHRGEGQPVMGVIEGDRVAGAAIIAGQAPPPTTLHTIAHGWTLLAPLFRVAGLAGLVRVLSTLETLTRNRPREPHLYLNVLGVEPAQQRRHFGAAMLDYLRQQVALRPSLSGVYLETSKEANVSFYTRFEYRVLSEIYPLGVRTWRMLQPRAGA
jgi:ribosomal protein S18 acetylase RimI-like enzyme